MQSRRTAIAAVSAMAALTALTASGCGVGLHFADHRYTMTPPDAHLTGPVSAVRLVAGSGHVRIRGGGQGVTIHRVVHYQSGRPHPDQRLENGTLTFSSGCSRCGIDYDVTVPATVRVTAHADSGGVEVTDVASADARSDSGTVRVRRVRGAVTAYADSGKVIVDDVGGPLDLGSDSGSIRGSALRSPTVHAHADSGSITLTFTAPPGDVSATADSGSIRVAVPPGRYDVRRHTDSGHADVRIATDPGAPAKISVRTDSGGVTVLPAGGS